MSDRDIIKIAISPKAKQAIDDTCDRYGMSQIELASRLYTWFPEQDETLQAAVLGILPKGLEVEIVKMKLERITKGDVPSYSRRGDRRRKKIG